MRGVSNIDISCAQTLRELVEGLRKKAWTLPSAV